ncbi:glycosyl hydrolase [Motilibacter aurantiacus]|uniref:glycosyl hydrolase n=1 Tax=Motilibacter aurantiacus TaxID=2714955 RepID=UPI00140D8FAA|nr:glycosyl hydrolase [Motilibacter aurantiacus]NHC47024.1 hypothetical protein [Motilibacter aurantiacus]
MRRLARPLLALAVSLAALAAPATAGAAASTPRHTAEGGAAGDTKTSCVYTAHKVSRMADFSSLVGRESTCAVVFNDVATDWATWSKPWFLTHSSPEYNWASWYRAGNGTRTLVVTQALVPTTLPADWRARGAGGEYDGQIREWAANLVRHGLGDVVVRLGHEANGDWYFDHIGRSDAEYADWRAFWRRFVLVARSVPGAAFEFDWTVNAGYRGVPFEKYYPGDDVVDIIGIDQYDVLAIVPWPVPVTPEARWQAILRQRYGITELMAFADAHCKPLSLPEWGLQPAGSGGGSGGGDDPYYVDRIAEIVRTSAVRYQGFWHKEAPPSQMALEANPGALSAYRSHFGARGDALGDPVVAAAPSAAPPAPTPAAAGPTTPSTTPVPSLPVASPIAPAAAAAPAPPAPAAPEPAAPPTVAAPAVPAPAPAGASPSVAAGARAGTTLRVPRSAVRARAGARLTLRGSLCREGVGLPARRVRLERRTSAGWALVATRATSTGGGVTFPLPAVASATYRMRFLGAAGLPPAASATVQVTVTPKLTARAGRRAVVGTVLPARRGTPVALVRAGRVVGSGRTDASGRYALRALRPGAYTVRAAGTAVPVHVR